MKLAERVLSRQELLSRVQSLPPLPQAVLELEAALRCDTAQTSRIVSAVACDQALSLTALRLANSSFYGVSGRVVSLRGAVQVLGLQTLSAVLTTAAILRSFSRPWCPGYDFDAGWRHALCTALCARLLAEATGQDAEAAYTAGLLHDVGRLVLAIHQPQALGEAIAQAAAHDDHAGAHEQALLGVDHATVGAMVAEHWRLSPAVVQAVRHHHDLPAQGSHPLCELLHVADNIAHALDLAHDSHDIVPPLSLAAWGRVAPPAERLQSLLAEVEARMQGVELDLFAAAAPDAAPHGALR